MITDIDKRITVSVANPKSIPMLWPLVSPQIEMAIEHSNKELTLESIYERLESTEMILLTVMEEGNVMAVLTLEKNHYPSGKITLNVTTTGGADMHLWLDKALGLCESIADQQGCDEIYIIGRAGWSRVLKDKGFDTVHTVLSKKVGG